MTKSQITKFKHSLEERRAELLRSLHELRSRIAIDGRGDTLDRVGRIADRELTLISIDLESALLARVEGALQEIRDGTFGICAECDGPIPLQRLAAVPWSPYCVACQEAEERGGGRTVYQGAPHALVA